MVFTPPDMNEDTVTVIDLTPENFSQYGVCGYKDMKHKELQRKAEWIIKYYPKGLRIKIILTDKGVYQGMIEYIPSEYAHRPVDAQGYMFIHCIFVGFKREFKGRGYASTLIDHCIRESKEAKMQGVAVVTRKGSFMTNKEIFLKKGFEVVDHANPDFELLALKFDSEASNPKFKVMNSAAYGDGITIFRSAQCPYSVKNVDAIINTAKKSGLTTRLIEIEDASAAQQTPCAFGTFCIVHNGKVVSHHPISNTRFENIIKGLGHRA